MTDHNTAWPPGVPCWADITVTDLARSEKFYNTVFGWEFSESSAEFGYYTNAMVDGRTVAGMSPPMEGWDDTSAWVVYLATDNVAQTHQAVVEAGGKPIMQPMEVGSFGHMCLCTDPTGSLVGLWQAKEHTGFQVTDEAGAVAWTDLMSTNADTAREFYATVFGFEYADMGPDYSTFTVPGRRDTPAGGLGQAQDGMTPGWNIAFWVDDVARALKTIEAASGQALGEPTDFEFGQFGPASGPDGEMFVVYNPKSAG